MSGKESPSNPRIDPPFARCGNLDYIDDGRSNGDFAKVIAEEEKIQRDELARRIANLFAQGGQK